MSLKNQAINLGTPDLLADIAEIGRILETVMSVDVGHKWSVNREGSRSVAILYLGCPAI